MLFDKLTAALFAVTLIILLLIATVVIVIVIARRQSLKQQLNEAVYRSKLNSTALAALRAQMNPHFIFNCLNSIKLYTEQNDAPTASEYLGKFSKLIRNMLDSARSDDVLLNHEVETLRLYLELESMRFKDKLRYMLVVDKNVESDFVEIPPLLIQPYVENAIWHGIMHRQNGGIVTVHISQSAEPALLCIQIQDDGIGRSQSSALKDERVISHRSHGTQINEARIALLNETTNRQASIATTDLIDVNGKAAGTLVTIQLPV